MIRTAVAADQGRLHGLPPQTIAVPLINTIPYVVPAAREASTTAITYLGFPSSFSYPRQRALAERYAHAVSVPGAPAAATGLIPATLAEADAINGSLRWVEIATVGMIALVVGIYLRSVVAPLVVLGAALVLYVLTTRGVTWVANHLGIALHKEVEPIVVVLLLGVITDYSVFFLTGFRDRMLDGESRLDAARHTTAQYLPIIFTAGLLVAAGLASLYAASIGFVRALGPGMALVVITTLLVALTLVPAALAVLGRVVLWPGVRGSPAEVGRRAESRGSRARRRLASALSRRWVAVPMTALVTAALMACASGLFHARVGMTVLHGLPQNHPAHRAADEAGKGFAPGIVAPTAVIVQRRGIASQERKLVLLGRLLGRSPGTAAALGAGVPGLPPRYDVFRASSGNAVRYLVVFEHSPFTASAVADLKTLERTVPQALARLGLAKGARVSYAGDTPIARDAFRLIYHDLSVVAGAIFAVNIVLLAIFLRSLVAPFYLVTASALSLAATFGVTTYLFEDLLGYGSLTYYIPLAAGVLLLAFGSDYNLFVVGRIWQEAKAMPTREAIVEAVPRASRAISVAGTVLALSFVMLAIVPLRPFREMGFAVAFGVLLDTFVVRTLLIPSLVTLAGRTSWWPSDHGKGTTAGERDERPPAADESADRPSG